MNRLKAFLFYILLFSTLFALSVSDILAKNNPTNLFEAFNNTEYGISINHPADWPVQEGYLGTIATFLAPLEDAGDQFRVNFNIMAQDLSQKPMIMPEYTQLLLTQLTQNMGGKIIAKKNTTLARGDAFQVIYTIKRGQIDLKVMQIWRLKDKFAYILSYTAEKKDYNKYYPIIEKMINSFRFID